MQAGDDRRACSGDRREDDGAGDGGDTTRGDESEERLAALGRFIREQRGVTSLSLRRLSEIAGVSNPYLSQIERGLRRPSAQILQQLARGLRISAETLYVQAGILDDREPDDDLDRRILADPHLSEEQRQALVAVYWSFRHGRDGAARTPEGGSGS